MAKFKSYIPHGVIPATLLALDDDYSIDIAASRKHLRDVAAVDGVSAITVNGHASEVHACSFDEQRQILEATACRLSPEYMPMGVSRPRVSPEWRIGEALPRFSSFPRIRWEWADICVPRWPRRISRRSPTRPIFR
jgi:hypothetical protein